MPPSAPNSLGEIRLERLRRLKELKAQKAARDAESAKDVAARFPLPGDLAKLIDPTTVVTPALQMLDRNLLNVADGDCERLIWSLPPQEGKSQRVSRYFPLWMLLRDPTLRIVIASYELGVARRWSRAIRNDIADHSELGLKVREDTAAAHEWQLHGHRGGVYAVGIGGGLTGRPADCVSGTTLVETSDGSVAIADLVRMTKPPKVLSWNHRGNCAEWRRIEASRAIPERELVEVCTESGRVIRCTPDHRIYTTTRGYITAVELCTRDRLVTLADSGSSSVCSLRDGVHQGLITGPTESARYEPVLLPAVLPDDSIGDPGLRKMWRQLWQTSVRSTEGEAPRLHASVLLEGVLHRIRVGSVRRSKTLHDLWWTSISRKKTLSLLLGGVPSTGLNRDSGLRALQDRVRNSALRTREKAPSRWRRVLLATVRCQWISGKNERRLCSLRLENRTYQRAEVLHSGMSGSQQDSQKAPRSEMSRLRGDVPAEVQSHGLLLSRVCGLGTLHEDDRRRELEISRRHQLFGLVPQDATVDLREGSRSVCCMSSDTATALLRMERPTATAQHVACASHQRESGEQLSREPDFAVRNVSRCTSPLSSDTVSMVRRVRGERHTVYDLQVEGNCNYFAGEVLSHNCMILDDPVKGRAEADSEAYRENTWEWWTETARTRLAPRAPVVLIMTRWSEDDLAGRLIEQDNNWRVINIAAQCETDSDPLGRETGEYLESARGRTPAEWDQIRKDVGERAWSALYQGRPAPAEGGMFKRSWWLYDETPVCYKKSDGTMHAQGMDVVIQSWDMTFKNTDGTDFVVGQVWGRAGATAHLLDQVRARLDFPETCKAVQDLSAKWPQASLKLIEDKANGPAVISQLRKQVPGMVPVNPEGNKQARAAAVTPFVEAGNVCLPLPARAPWVGALIEEASAFPTGAHDDQVDALTQALARLMLMPSSTAFLEELVNRRSG